MERNFSAADGRCALITHNKNNSMRQLAPSFHCFLLWFLRFRCFALLLFSLSSRLFFISLIIKEKKRQAAERKERRQATNQWRAELGWSLSLASCLWRSALITNPKKDTAPAQSLPLCCRGKHITKRKASFFFCWSVSLGRQSPQQINFINSSH